MTTRQTTDMKLCKAQITKAISSGELLGLSLSKLAGPLLKVAVSLVKNVLVPLEITSAVSAIGAGSQKKYIVQEEQR